MAVPWLLNLYGGVAAIAFLVYLTLFLGDRETVSGSSLDSTSNSIMAVLFMGQTPRSRRQPHLRFARALCDVDQTT